MNYINGAFGHFEGLTFGDHPLLSLYGKECYQHFAENFPFVAHRIKTKSDEFGST